MEDWKKKIAEYEQKVKHKKELEEMNRGVETSKKRDNVSNLHVVAMILHKAFFYCAYCKEPSEGPFREVYGKHYGYGENFQSHEGEPQWFKPKNLSRCGHCYKYYCHKHIEHSGYLDEYICINCAQKLR